MEKFNNALATSFRILSKKAYSENEIRKKLKGFEYDDEIIEQVLEKLLQMKLLDDEDYANLIIKNYTLKGCGRLKIREELYKRGIPSDILKLKMLEYEVDYDIVLKLFEKKLQGDITEYKNIEKAKSYIYRKGFTFDEVNFGFSLYKENLEDG